AALSLLQAVAAGFTALFTYRIGMFFLPSGWALTAVVLLVFEPLVVAIHMLMMPETLFVLFVLVFSYYLLRAASGANTYDWYVAAGFFALAVYTKPAAVYLIIPAALFALFAKNGARNALVFISVIVIALVPWIVRNHAVSGQYVVTTNASKNICQWGSTGILAVKYRVDASDWNTTVYLSEHAAIMSRCSGAADALKIFISEYPAEFTKLMAIAVVSMLTNDGYTVLFEKPADEQIKIHHNYLTPAVLVNADWQYKVKAALNEYNAVELTAIGIGKLFWFLVSMGAVAGAIAALRQKSMRRDALFLALVTVYFLAASAAAAGLAAGARYRYQIDAFLLIFAFVAAHALYQKKLLQLPETRDITDVDDPSTTLIYGRIIRKKPFLKRLYRDFYEQIKKLLPDKNNNPVIVELGSGCGFIKDVIPGVITSDVIPLPGIDKQFSVLAMPFPDNSVDAFVMLDVLHHVGETRKFFHELNRCLTTGGKVIMIEPANTLWSRFLYKHFHQESFDPSAGWEFASTGPLSSANSAIPWIVFYRDRAQFEKEFPTLQIRSLRPHTPLRYVISGGVTMRQLLPSFMYPLVKGIEIILSPLNRHIGMFLTIEIEKTERHNL
ncbi:MAG: glycosyltransferase family 39 protein, partial [Patescibacteria group bacterium]